MCVDLESATKHAKRLKLKNRFRRDSEPSGRRMRLTRRARGRVHVPTVLAAIEADVVDAIAHEEDISTTRIPPLPTLGTPISRSEVKAVEQHRRAEAQRRRELWLEQHPYALAVA